jgi:8-oxo-dGTP pyrophosphatase MutT (NUDIX family)
MSLNKWNSFLTESELKTVGIVVCLNDNQQFLIIKRSGIDGRGGQWTVPGGHIDEKDCTIEHGAVRELKEETNLNCEVCDLVYLGQPKPEKFYFYAKSWDGSVDVGIPNPETDEIEHDDYKWATIDDIKDLANTEIPIYLLEKALDMSKNAK